MASNIGIKVKVDFPTQGELESAFKEKWKGVKANLDAKVNISADENSLRSLNTRIKNLLGEQKYDIKITTNLQSVTDDISKTYSKFRELRAEMEKGIDIKVNTQQLSGIKSQQGTTPKPTGIGSGVSEAEQSMKSMQRAMDQSQSSANGLASAFQKVVTTTKNGKTVAKQYTTELENGAKAVSTMNANGNKTVKITQDNLAAERQYVALYKEQESLAVKLRNTDEQTSAAIIKRMMNIKAEMNTLRNGFKDVDFDDSSFIKAKTSVIDLARALKESALTTAEQNATAKELAQTENEMYRLVVRLHGADSNETQEIARQLTSLESSYNVRRQNAEASKDITRAQAESLDKLRAEHTAQESLLAAKKSDTEAVQRQNAEYANAVTHLRTAAALQKQLASAGANTARVIKEQRDAEVRLANEAEKTADNIREGTSARKNDLAVIKQQISEEAKYTQRLNSAKNADSNSHHGRQIYQTIDPVNIAQTAWGGGQQLVENLAEVDQAIMSVIKVAGGSNASLAEFRNNIYDTATSVGRSATEYAESVERWATAGKSLNESIELSKVSSMGSFVGNIDEQDMVDYMSIPINAFKKDMIGAKDVVNAMNEVANDNAIEMDDLGKAYVRAATTASSSGESFAQLTGLISGAQEATRAGGEKIGTALKAMDVNFGKISAKLTKTDATKSDFFTRIGAPLKDGNGNLRSTYEILGDINKKWDGLSDSDKQIAGFYAAGKQHAAVFAGIMQDWAGVEKATKEAQGQVDLFDKDNGSAYTEFQRQQQGMQFHIAALKNAWDKFLTSLAGGDDAQKNISNILDNITDTMGKITKLASDPKIRKIATMGIKVTALLAIQSAIHKLFSAVTSGVRTTISSFGGIKSSVNELKLQWSEARAEVDRYKIAAKEAQLSSNGSSVGSKANVSKLKDKAGNLLDVGADVAESKLTSKVGSEGLEKMSVGAEKFAAKKAGVAAVGTAIKGVAGVALAAVPYVDMFFTAFTIVDTLSGGKLWDGIVTGFKMITHQTDQGTEAVKKYAAQQIKLEKSLADNGWLQSRYDSAGALYEQYKKITAEEEKASKKSGKPAQYSSDEFKQMQTSFNKQVKELNKELAGTKHGKLDISMKVNNYADVQRKMAALKEAKDYLENKAVNKAMSDVSSFSTGKLQKSWDVAFKTTQQDWITHSKKMTSLANQMSMASQANDSGKLANLHDQYSKTYTEMEHDLNGFANSKAFKKLEKQWDGQVKDIYKVRQSMMNNIDSVDTSTIKEKNQDTFVGMAGISVTELSQEDRLYESINNKIKNKQNLTVADQQALAKLNPEYASLGEVTAKWGDDTRSAVTGAISDQEKYNNTLKKTAETKMSEVMTKQGYDQNEIDAAIAAYEKGGSALVDKMGEFGQQGAKLMGYSAKAIAIYGDDWANQVSKMTDQIGKLPKEEVTKYKFIDESTGAVSSQTLESLNQIPKDVITKFSLQNEDGSYNFDNVSDLLDGINQLPDNVKTKYFVDTNKDGMIDLQEAQTRLKSLPKEQRTDAIMAITDFLNKGTAVDSEKKQLSKPIQMQVTMLLNDFNKHSLEAKTAVTKIDTMVANPKFKGDTKYLKSAAKGGQSIIDQMDKLASVSAMNGDTKGVQKANKVTQAVMAWLNELSSTSYMKGDHSKADAAQRKVLGLLGELGTESSMSHMNGDARDAIRKANDAGSHIKKVPKSHNTSFIGGISKGLRSAWNEVSGWASKHLSVVVDFFNGKSASSSKGKGHGSVSTATYNAAGQASISASISSASVSSNAKTGISSTLNKPVAVHSASTATDDEKNYKMSEDVWRYWTTNLYSIPKAEAAFTKISNDLTKVKDDVAKQIPLYKQQISSLNQQISVQRSLQKATMSERSSLLNQLSKYGFRANGSGEITNLSHASALKGTSAKNAEEILNKYNTAMSSLTSISSKIADLQQQQWTINESIATANETLKLAKIDSDLAKITAKMQVITNNIDLISKKAGYISDTDFGLKTAADYDGIQVATDAMGQLISQFRALSQVQTKTTDEGTKYQSELSSLQSQILTAADAIITYRESINSIKVTRLGNDFSKFFTQVKSQIAALDNNITNLKDGLLSGTDFSDLNTSNLTVLDFNQASGLEKYQQDRLKLEANLDKAMADFTSKNVTREKDAAKTVLSIKADEYSALTNMAKAYSNGQKTDFTNYIPTLDYKMADTGSNTETLNANEKNMIQTTKKYEQELDQLKASYESMMNSANSYEEKQAVNNQFIMDQLSMQQQIYEANIESYKDAIKQTQALLNDDTLTSAQRDTLDSQISDYEQSITDAQNSIKTSIKSRFDYEFSLIAELTNKYKEQTTELTSLQTMAKTMGFGSDANLQMSSLVYAGKQSEYNAMSAVYQKLLNEQSQFEEGSYEWKQFETQVESARTSLSSMTNDLLSANKDVFTNQLDIMKASLEKGMLDGMTSDEYKTSTEYWLTGVQKEIELEKLRRSAAEAEDTAMQAKVRALDAQSKVSAQETGYLEKQIAYQKAKNELLQSQDRKTKTIVQNKDGSYDWQYVVDQKTIDSQEEAAETAKNDLAKYRETARTDYVTKLSAILDTAKNGDLSVNDLKSKISDLNDTYSPVLDDIPDVHLGDATDISGAYQDYLDKNQAIIGTYGSDTGTMSSDGYQTLVNGFQESFKNISSQLGDIFGKAFNNVLYKGTLADGTQVSGGISINNMDLSFPNITDPNELQNALTQLPQAINQAINGK